MANSFKEEHKCSRGGDLDSQRESGLWPMLFTHSSPWTLPSGEEREWVFIVITHSYNRKQLQRIISKWPSFSNFMYFNMKGSTGAYPVTGLQFLVIIKLSLWASLRGYERQSFTYTEGYINRAWEFLLCINDFSESESHPWLWSVLHISEKDARRWCLPPASASSYSYNSYLLSFFSPFVFVLRQGLLYSKLCLSPVWHQK